MHTRILFDKFLTIHQSDFAQIYAKSVNCSYELALHAGSAVESTQNIGPSLYLYKQNPTFRVDLRLFLQCCAICMQDKIFSLKNLSRLLFMQRWQMLIIYLLTQFYSYSYKESDQIIITYWYVFEHTECTGRRAGTITFASKIICGQVNGAIQL